MRISLQEATFKLLNSEVVAVATETVYGLAASAFDPAAIKKIYTLKSRPLKNPLIIHVASFEDVKKYTESLPESFDALAKAFWPGPMTLVVPIKTDLIPSIVTAGLATAAFRVPSHPLALELIKMTGPLVMPSANISGKPSATSADHVEEDFKSDFPVLDGGSSKKGLESTILIWNLKKWVVGRLGSLEPSSFLKTLGYTPQFTKIDINLNEKPLMRAPICPGQMYRHYAPNAKLILIKSKELKNLKNGEAILGFDDRNYAEGFKVYSLGNSTNPEIAAERLYSILRQLDDDGVKKALVDMNFPQEGLWITIRERLEKASSS